MSTSERPAFTANVLWRARNRVASWLLLGALIGTVALFSCRLNRPGFVPPMFALVCGLLVGAPLFARRRRTVPIQVLVNDVGVFIGGVLAMSRSDIAAGGEQRLEDGRSLVILLGRRSEFLASFVPFELVFILQDPLDAVAVLKAAGVHAVQRVLRVTFLAQRFWHFLIPIPLFVAAQVAIFSFLPANLRENDALHLLSVVLPNLACWMLMRSVLTVGADGVLIRRALRSRFISFEDLEDVRLTRNQHLSWKASLVLTLRSGEEIKLSAVGDVMNAGNPAEKAITQRILDGVRASRSGVPLDNAHVLLGRGNRGALEWVRALRALGAGASAQYRSSSVSPDALQRSLEDPSLDPATRLGAAVALLAAESPSAKDTVLAAAAASASPRLRLALEEVARGAADDLVYETLEAFVSDAAKSTGSPGS